MAKKVAWTSDEEAEIFVNTLRRIISIQGCPVCKKQRFELLNEINIKRMGASRRALITAICQNCGHVLEFDLKYFLEIDKDEAASKKYNF